MKHKSTNLLEDQVSSPQTLTITELEKNLDTNREDGLLNNIVSIHQKKYGNNKLKEGKKTPLFIRFLAQFKDLMIIILLVASALSFVPLFIRKNLSITHWIEPFIIIAIVFINAIIGVIQEVKADKALESLKNMITPLAKVIRHGELITIPAKEVTIGDLIFFEAGDKISVDARIVEANHLQINESSLTGESLASEKKEDTIWKQATPLGDRDNMVFSGCSVAVGSGRAIVTNIGMETEIGKIATMICDKKIEKTPFQKQLAGFGKWLSFFCLGVCVVMLALEIGLEWQGIVKDPVYVVEPIMLAVSIAVAAIPEGLPIVITIAMSAGVIKMAKQHAVVKDLPSVETLGSASIICSDKTGTLTQNKMTLKSVYLLSKRKVFEVDNNNKDIKELLEYASLCSNASIKKEGNKELETGDPTEIAIIRGYHNYGENINDLNDDYKRLHEIPFDSDRKLMTTVNRIKNKNVVIVKGAASSLLALSSNTSKEKKALVTHSLALSNQGLRVIGVATKTIKTFSDEKGIKHFESKLHIIGLITMMDPPRENVKTSIQECINGGIKVIMITGDHVLTAKKIAKDLNIFGKGDIAITGEELDQMSDKVFLKRIEHITVYARVSPANKLRIIKAWQLKNKAVAMTGDGVNDAPALKQADIGCAMGIAGTDVSKDAANIILSDDNFSTIIGAIKEGRCIFTNILKTINFLLTTNFVEVMTLITVIIVAAIMGLAGKDRFEPLSPIQILWINLISDSFPAIALGFEPKDKNIMFAPPRNIKQSIFANGLWLKIILESIVYSAVCIGAFYIGFYMSDTNYINTYGSDFKAHELAGSTLCFLSLSIIELLHVFHIKSSESIFKTKLLNNKSLLFAFGLSVGLTFLVALIPQIGIVFHMVGLYYGNNWMLYLLVLGLVVFVPLVFMELEKLFFAKVYFPKILKQSGPLTRVINR